MIRIDGPWFKDEFGRTLMLRGVNLGGSSKVPSRPDGSTYRREGFFNHRSVSFVGRPFPLEEADEHFERLRTWGFTLIRFLVTWEAIEHAGPGDYDLDYIHYVRDILVKAHEFGFSVFIDPHQDVWSRFTGGDGAPGWTLEVAGFQMENFTETGAAIVHAIHGDPFPRMIWPTNAAKLAAATMATLFFAGNDFAPQALVDGEPVQDYLQNHFIAAIGQLAKFLVDLPNVIGYDTFNEPFAGYLGCTDLRKRAGLLQWGECPTPFQSMLLGEGFPQDVEILEQRVTGTGWVGTKKVNPSGIRAWKPNAECVWKMHGVWEVDKQNHHRLLRPGYFSAVDGKKVDFNQDYLKPFANKFAQTIRGVHPGTMIFFEGEPLVKPPVWEPNDAHNIVYAPHWYDGYVLYFKSFSSWRAAEPRGRARLVLGKGAIRRSFAAQVREIHKDAKERMGNPPVVVGEVGLPFDLDKKRAFRTGDYHDQIAAINRSLTAMDDNLMNYTLWNYTADNTNERGDRWNDEDFSIFSRDQQTNPASIHSGARALEGFVRPYPIKTPGEPLKLFFNPRDGYFEYTFRHDPLVFEPTVIFLPGVQYPRGVRVELSDGAFQISELDELLEYTHDKSRPEHTIRVYRR
jgi:hypothetical protein